MKKIIFSFLVIFLLISCATKSTILLNQKQIIELSNTGVSNKVKDLDNTGILYKVKDLNNTGIVDKVDNHDKKIVKNQISGLEEDLAKFSDDYNKALLNIGKGDEKSIEQIKNISVQWRNIIYKYRGYNVKGFEKTINLDEKLVSIGIFLLNSTDFITSGKVDLSNKELEKIRVLISKIREENKIHYIGDDLYVVKKDVEELISDGKNKNESKIELVRLGIKKLSKYKNSDKEYKKMLSKFEKSFIDFNKLSGDEYLKQLPELQKLFMKIYLKYN